MVAVACNCASVCDFPKARSCFGAGPGLAPAATTGGTLAGAAAGGAPLTAIVSVTRISTPH